MPRLIVADDFEPVRHSLRMYLEARGLGPCEEASNGLEALSLARQSKPDAVILDYSMPVMNGAESAEAFRNEMPDVPIFLFTGHATPAQRTLPGTVAVGVFSKDKIIPLVDAVSDYLRKSPSHH
jgi:CheY-like chemotaxis protein